MPDRKLCRCDVDVITEIPWYDLDLEMAINTLFD